MVNFAQTDEQAVYDSTVPYMDNNYHTHSIIAEWFVFILWAGLCFESMFTRYIWPIVVERQAFWTRLTPLHLFPSDLLFYGPIFLISIFVVLRGRRYGYKTSRGIWLVIILLVLGAIQAIHGLMAGSTGKFWLSDYKQMVLGSIFVPFFCVLAPRIRVWKLAERFCRIGVVLAIYNGVRGALILVGGMERYAIFAPHFSGEYILLLMYAFVLIRSIVTGKASKLILAALAFGIILPLSKPALSAFVSIHPIAFITIWMFGKRIGFLVRLRSVKMMVITGLLITVIMAWLLTLGQGEAKRHLAKRFLKTGEYYQQRDLSGGRFGAYRWAILKWTEYPVFGTGFGIYMPVRTWHKNEDEAIPVHNLPLQILYETGLIGFIICFTTFFIWLRRIYIFFKTYPDISEQWPLLGMFTWAMTMIISALIGQTLGIVQIGFMFWICVAFLSNAEAQHYMTSLYEGYGGEEEINTNSYESGVVC